MSRPNRIYLDTNIFIAFVEQDDDISKILRRLVMNAPKQAKPYFVTSELTFSELIVKLFRDGAQLAIQNYDSMLVSGDWLDLAPVDRPALYNAGILRAEYSHLRLPDAIHLSTAIGRECSHFLTADLGIKSDYRLPGSSASLQILRPDEPALTSLLKSIAE